MNLSPSAAPLKIVFGCDHAGYHLHIHLLGVAASYGYVPIDCGTFDQASVDYPDCVEKVVEAIKTKEADYGVLTCGTGIGMSIAANRYYLMFRWARYWHRCCWNMSYGIFKV